MSELRHTPLHDIHQSLGAKMVPFGEWHMPLQYTGILDEHKAVREAAGLFDVSHMGEIDVKGPHALDFVQRMTTNDAARLHVGQAQYSLLCSPGGGIVDDIFVYKLSEKHYMLCVNASNTEKDFTWLNEQCPPDLNVGVDDVSAHFAQLAVQGPKAVSVLNSIANKDLNSIKYFCFDFADLDGSEVMASRTGYTGEDGFEIYVSPEKAVRLWEAITDAGKDDGLKPVGLGARDTLRLEMKYSLYGNDITKETTPLEANLGWVVKFHKSDFIGKKSLLRQKEAGIDKKLVCLIVDGREIPRRGYEISLHGRFVGSVTSGTRSPSLGKGIAMGYVENGLNKERQELDIIIRGKKIAARVINPPFYKKTTQEASHGISSRTDIHERT